MTRFEFINGIRVSLIVDNDLIHEVIDERLARAKADLAGYRDMLVRESAEVTYLIANRYPDIEIISAANAAAAAERSIARLSSMTARTLVNEWCHDMEQWPEATLSILVSRCPEFKKLVESHVHHHAVHIEMDDVDGRLFTKFSGVIPLEDGNLEVELERESEWPVVTAEDELDEDPDESPRQARLRLAAKRFRLSA